MSSKLWGDLPLPRHLFADFGSSSSSASSSSSQFVDGHVDRPNALHHPRDHELDTRYFSSFPNKEALILVKCDSCHRNVLQSAYNDHASHCHGVSTFQAIPVKKKPPGPATANGKHPAAIIKAAPATFPANGFNIPCPLPPHPMPPPPGTDAAAVIDVDASTSPALSQPTTAAATAAATQEPASPLDPDTDPALFHCLRTTGVTMVTGPAIVLNNPPYIDPASLPPSTHPLPADGRVDFDRMCGVLIIGGGGRCRNPLTCKVHTESEKRCVRGRTMPFNSLLLRHFKEEHERLLWQQQREKEQEEDKEHQQQLQQQAEQSQAATAAEKRVPAFMSRLRMRASSPAAVKSYGARRVGTCGHVFGASKGTRRLRYAVAYQLTQQQQRFERRQKAKQAVAGAHSSTNTSSKGHKGSEDGRNKTTANTNSTNTNSTDNDSSNVASTTSPPLSRVPRVVPALRLAKGRVVSNALADVTLPSSMYDAITAPSQQWSNTVSVATRVRLLERIPPPAPKRVRARGKSTATAAGASTPTTNKKAKTTTATGTPSTSSAATTATTATRVASASSVSPSTAAGGSKGAKGKATKAKETKASGNNNNNNSSAAKATPPTKGRGRGRPKGSGRGSKQASKAKQGAAGGGGGATTKAGGSKASKGRGRGAAATSSSSSSAAAKTKGKKGPAKNSKTAAAASSKKPHKPGPQAPSSPLFEQEISMEPLPIDTQPPARHKYRYPTQQQQSTTAMDEFDFGPEFESLFGTPTMGPSAAGDDAGTGGGGGGVEMNEEEVEQLLANPDLFPLEMEMELLGDVPPPTTTTTTHHHHHHQQQQQAQEQYHQQQQQQQQQQQDYVAAGEHPALHGEYQQDVPVPTSVVASMSTSQYAYNTYAAHAQPQPQPQPHQQLQPSQLQPQELYQPHVQPQQHPQQHSSYDQQQPQHYQPPSSSYTYDAYADTANTGTFPTSIAPSASTATTMAAPTTGVKPAASMQSPSPSTSALAPSSASGSVGGAELDLDALFARREEPSLDAIFTTPPATASNKYTDTAATAQPTQHQHQHQHQHHSHSQQNPVSYNPRGLIPNAPLFSRQDLQRQQQQQQQQKLSVLHEQLSLAVKATAVKATKATIRVPLVAARILISHESLLQKFQLLTNITYITCCSDLDSCDNLAELLVRGTKDSVQHARDALQRLADSVKLEHLPTTPPVSSAVMHSTSRPTAPASSSASSGSKGLGSLQEEGHHSAYGQTGSDGFGRQSSFEAGYGGAPQEDSRHNSAGSTHSLPGMSSNTDMRYSGMGTMSSSASASHTAQPSPHLSHRTSPHMAGRAASAPPHSLAYIFVDNSNIFIGAQLEGSVRDLAVRVNIRALCEIIEDNMPCAFRAVAGTNPHSGRIWHEWENNHYRTLLDRSDASMHNVIAAKIDEVANSGANPQTLVLATGDGNEVEGNESFPRLAERAIQHGWRVRVWSWEQSLSGKFRDLKERFNAYVTIHFLDPFKERITFKAGQGSRSVSSGPTPTPSVMMGPAGGGMPHRGPGGSGGLSPNMHRRHSVGAGEVDADPFMMGARFRRPRFNGFPPNVNAGMMQGFPPQQPMDFQAPYDSVFPFELSHGMRDRFAPQRPMPPAQHAFPMASQNAFQQPYQPPAAEADRSSQPSSRTTSVSSYGGARSRLASAPGSIHADREAVLAKYGSGSGSQSGATQQPRSDDATPSSSNATAASSAHHRGSSFMAPIPAEPWKEAANTPLDEGQEQPPQQQQPPQHQHQHQQQPSRTANNAAPDASLAASFAAMPLPSDQAVSGLSSNSHSSWYSSDVW